MTIRKGQTYALIYWTAKFKPKSSVRSDTYKTFCCESTIVIEDIQFIRVDFFKQPDDTHSCRESYLSIKKVKFKIFRKSMWGFLGILVQTFWLPFFVIHDTSGNRIHKIVEKIR